MLTWSLCNNHSLNNRLLIVAAEISEFMLFFIIVYCPKGQEGNVSCTMCQMNYIKIVAGISACSACKGNYTANADRDDCSESR